MSIIEKLRAGNKVLESDNIALSRYQGDILEERKSLSSRVDELNSTHLSLTTTNDDLNKQLAKVLADHKEVTSALDIALSKKEVLKSSYAKEMSDLKVSGMEKDLKIHQLKKQLCLSKGSDAKLSVQTTHLSEECEKMKSERVVL